MPRKALLIGIDDYPKKWALPSCVHDCDELEKVLTNNLDDSKSPNFAVTKLPNCKSSVVAENAIRDVFANVGQDVSLLYFSGHGYVDANNNGQILFPKNIQPGNTYIGLLMRDIMKIVSKSTVNNKIVILDCCHSGIIANNDDNVATLPNGCTILTACHPMEQAQATLSHSLFTHLLIQALNGEAADYMGHITIGGIYSYIDRSMGWQGQRPIFKTNITSFVSLRDVTPKVGVNILKRGLHLFKNVDEMFQLDPSFEDTNDPKIEHKYVEPYANEENVANFKILQKLQSIGFVEPVDEEFMYFAAMNSKKCRLTEIGKYYWKLDNNNML